MSDTPELKEETAEAAAAPDVVTPAPTATFADLARNESFEMLEEVWLEGAESAGSVDAFREAIEVLVKAGHTDRATTLVSILAEALHGAGRHTEAFLCIRPVALVAKGKEQNACRKLILASIRGMHAGEDWFPLFFEKSGLDDTGPLADALETFEGLLDFRPGSILLNPRDGLVGRIESLDPATGITRVRFSDGSDRSLKIEVVQELLHPVSGDDWRARYLQDPEAVRAEAMEHPSRMIQEVAKSRGGRVTAPHLKADLLEKVIPKARWNTWWKRARDEATRDPLISVEGSKTRPVFVRRERALSLDEEASRQVRWAKSLSAAVAEAAKYRREEISDETRVDMTQEIVRRLGSELAALKATEPGAALDAALACEEWGGPTRETANGLLRESVEEGQSRLGTLLDTMPAKERRGKAFARLRALYPDDWIEKLLDGLGDMSGAALDDSVALLIAEGEGDRIASTFRTHLASPYRHREAVLHLTSAWAANRLPGDVSGAEILDAFLPLARDLTRPPRGEKPSPQLGRRLVNLLVGGKSPLIVRLLDDAKADEIERWGSFIDTNPDLPWEIALAIRARTPEAEDEDEGAFWKGAAIFCTRAGITRRREELRVVVEEKIPANTLAIGEAARQGDLSENAEWTAALEEQKSLADLAKLLEDEIARAVAIEDVQRPGEVAVPGSRVRYREEASGEEQTVTILGPWDEGDDVVSYRAPVAQGLLGRKVGEQTSLHLPSGAIDVTLLSIESVV